MNTRSANGFNRIRRPTMSRIFLFAILAAAMLPLAAQAQQGPGGRPPSGPKPTVADVQRVVKGIAADKAKADTYCEIMKLDQQLAQAEQAKDEKKADELAKQADELAQKLGPEYNSLMDRLQQIDPSSQEGQRFVAAFAPLDKQCAGK
jgi:hypothetical protein